MQEKLVYEYAIVRIVPKVEREEFVNVGLILLCKRARFLKFRFTLHEEKIRCFCKEFDIEQAQENLISFEKICNGDKTSGPIAQLEVEERFRWITAVKSSSIQSSRPHPGLSADLEKTFEELYNDFVL